MNKTMKSILYASSILLVLVACLLTGHSQSPLRFLFFPLIILLADRTTLNILLKAGFKRVHSLRGGINAWAKEVDPSLPIY